MRGQQLLLYSEKMIKNSNMIIQIRLVPCIINTSQVVHKTLNKQVFCIDDTIGIYTDLGLFKNKKGTTSTQNIIKNKIKTPHPATSFSYRPAKLKINFTWPNKVYISVPDITILKGSLR